MFCVLLFSFENNVFLLLSLCILTVMFILIVTNVCSVYSVFTVLFSVLLVCKCVLYYCQWVSNQLLLTNISYRKRYDPSSLYCPGENYVVSQNFSLNLRCIG
jgi:hypothetical protein